MKESEQRLAAKRFVTEWTERGDEKSDTQSFWLALLRDVYGVEHPESVIQFEKRVKLKNISFIDASIPVTHVLIELFEVLDTKPEERDPYLKPDLLEFPYVNGGPCHKKNIARTAQGILDARALYPDSSLADLYDELTMPPELRKAHQANDRAVMQAYGFSPKMTEPEIVAALMQRYQDLCVSQKP